MLRQMRYFIAVVETNSFFEAGEACHISQSAISQQIRVLENELQVELLERHGRKFTVTPAGQYFYKQAKLQVQAVDSVVREVRRIGRGEYQRLRVGVLNGFSGRIIESTVRAFSATHPNVQLSLTTGTHEARMNAAAGNGFYPCDEDMPVYGNTVRVPLLRNGAPLARKMFAFWPVSADSSLQREFTALLKRNLK